MTFLGFTGLINFLTCISIAIFVILKNRKNPLNISFSNLNFSVALYSLGYFLWQLSKNENQALFWFKILVVGIILINITYLYFVFNFLGLIEQKRKLLRICAVINLIFIILNLVSLFYSRLEPRFNLGFWPTPTVFFHIYLIFWFWQCLYGFYWLLKGLRLCTGLKHEQVKYFTISAILGFAGGATNWPSWYNIHFPPYLNISISLYIGLVAYAIFRFRLLNINLALTRAGIFIFVYLFVLGIPFVLGYKYGSWQIATWVTVILATAGPFIFLFLQRRAEKVLRKVQLAYQQALRSTSSTMMLNKDLDKLLKVIVLNVVDIVKVAWAAVYLKDEKQAKYILKHKRSRLEEIGLPGEFALDSALAKHLCNSKLPLIGEELHSQELKVGLAVPCFLDSNMIGFLLLGDKPKGQIYDQSDVNEFTLLANQTALAIENCQFYAQEREHHHLLRVASLDRQIADMAHEIDNPNQALLGCLYNLELTLDEVAVNVPKEKMDHLKEKINKARFHTMRISKMITAVREFSKPTTGELVPVNLQWILDDLATILQPQIKHEGVTFIQDIPKEPVWLRANKVEIEQVLVNLGTNSVQAIQEVVTAGMNTPGWGKEINLKAYKIDNNMLRIDFSDTGSGIEKKLIEDIFFDFVTTKASTTGTGLGLAISRKIISKHNGKIWAESEGKYKGAAFHIELPIPKDISKEDIRKAEEERGNKTRGVTWNT